ncbi:hypothetical protein STENM223S_05879 [Streptomyces tendae]
MTGRKSVLGSGAARGKPSNDPFTRFLRRAPPDRSGAVLRGRRSGGPGRPGDAAGAADPVEREYELSVVSDLVRRTAAGHPGLLLVEGQEGIGKTTLLRSLAELARAQGLRVLEARGERTGRQTPFAVAHALLHPYLTDLEEGPALCDGPVAEAPGTAIAAGRAPYPVGHNNVVGWPEGKYDVLAGLHRTVRRISRPGPVLLVVDDAEQADAASLRFLAHTARRLSGMPVLLAVSRCPETDAPLLDEMATRPLSSVLRLRPLTERGIGLIARRLTGRSGDQEFLAACLSATNGIPLLVTRLLAALHREGSPLTAAGIARAHLEDVALFGRRVVATLHQQPVALRAAQAMAVLGVRRPLRALRGARPAGPGRVHAGRADPGRTRSGVVAAGHRGLVLRPSPDAGDGPRGHVAAAADCRRTCAARLLRDGGAPASNRSPSTGQGSSGHADQDRLGDSYLVAHGRGPRAALYDARLRPPAASSPTPRNGDLFATRTLASDWARRVPVGSRDRQPAHGWRRAPADLPRMAADGAHRAVARRAPLRLRQPAFRPPSVLLFCPAVLPTDKQSPTVFGRRYRRSHDDGHHAHGRVPRRRSDDGRTPCAPRRRLAAGRGS